MNDHSPVSPNLSEEILSFSNKESESSGGGELSEVGDEFVGKEVELLNEITWDLRLSKERVESYNTPHLPPWNWYPHRVRSKVKRRAHRKKLRRMRSGTQIVSLDYVWSKAKEGDSEESQSGHLISVMRYRHSKPTRNRVVEGRSKPVLDQSGAEYGFVHRTQEGNT